MKDLLGREAAHAEEDHLIQQIEILKKEYMQQIQPYVDRLVQIRQNVMPERIFILDRFSPEVLTKKDCKSAELFNSNKE